MDTRQNRLVEAVLTSIRNICFEQKHKKYQNVLSENIHFFIVKFSVYLNMHVFVMLSSFPTDLSKAKPMLQFFGCASLASYMEFVLSLFVPHLSFFWGRGRDVLCDCGISWVSSLIFLCKINVLLVSTIILKLSGDHQSLCKCERTAESYAILLDYLPHYAHARTSNIILCC